MDTLSDTAMVLAAGLGTRMRPLTLIKPKPLQLVGGKTMLDHALDRLVTVGIKRAVVNTYYLPEQIEEHLSQRRNLEIIISREQDLLDTGGGIKKVLSHFDGKPFFALNADLPWMDVGTPSLQRMAEFWDATKMDVLLLLMQTRKAHGFSAKGDFIMEPDGRVHRKATQTPYPYVLISAQIMKPELFATISDKIFSNNVIWDKVEVKHKLFGIEHNGTCYHVGTPEDLQKANDLLKMAQGWGV